jgi:phage tail protein X
MYTTRQGDTWDIIAYQQLGDELLLGKLKEANPRHMEYVIFPAGIKLVIPSVSAEEAAQNNLPPWKRGRG